MAQIVNLDSHTFTITSKNTSIEMEITVEKGLGYVPVENRKTEKLPVGVVAIDAFFTPVINVNYTIENMRVGERTDYNKLKIFITTDGSIAPSNALHKSANILKDHIEKVSQIEVMTMEKEIKVSRKKVKKKKEK